MKLRLSSGVLIFLTAASAALLFIMLGQVDFIIWGGINPPFTWTMPLPTFHWGNRLVGVNPPGMFVNGTDTWTSIYAYITGSFFAFGLFLFELGRRFGRR